MHVAVDASAIVYIEMYEEIDSDAGVDGCVYSDVQRCTQSELHQHYCYYSSEVHHRRVKKNEWWYSYDVYHPRFKQVIVCISMLYTIRGSTI